MSGVQLAARLLEFFRAIPSLQSDEEIISMLSIVPIWKHSLGDMKSLV